MRWSTLVALSLAALVGCDNSGSTPSGTSGSGAPGKGTIVYIAKNQGNPYFEPLAQGFKKAVEENGYTFAEQSPATAEATSQLRVIKDQIQLKAKAIAISPNSTDALNTVFDEAMGKGIPVVTVDSDLTGNEQHRSAGVITVDVKSVGEGQIETLGSMINYEGKFAILSATTDAPNQNAWIAVMKETLKQPKYAKMELVEIVYGNDEPQKSVTEAESLLTKYADLKGIIAPTTVGIRSAAQVVQNAKKADSVMVTGLGLPSEMRAFVNDGTVKAFALWNPYDEGYLAGQVASQLADGTLKPAPGVTFKAGTLGERTFGEKSVVVTGPPFVFTKDNIDQFQF